MAAEKEKRVAFRVLLRDIPATKEEKELNPALRGDYDILKDAAKELPEGFTVSRYLRDRIRTGTEELHKRLLNIENGTDALYRRVLSMVQERDVRLTLDGVKTTKSCIFDLTMDTKNILVAMAERLTKDTGKGKLNIVFRAIMWDFIDHPEPPAGRGRPIKNPIEKFSAKKVPFSFHIRRVFRTAGESGKAIETLDAVNDIARQLGITKSEFYSKAIHSFSGRIMFEPPTLEREQVIIYLSESADRRVKELTNKDNFNQLRPYQDGRIRNSTWYLPEVVEEVISHSHAVFNKRKASKADVVRAAIYEELAQTVDYHSAGAKRGD